MPFATGKFLLKKGKRYDVATKSLFVLPVQLLDNTLMECTVQEDSNGQELLLHVAQRLGIHENEIDYFGLKFVNKHLQYQWLSLEVPLKRQLLKAHDLFVKFSVRFYVRNVHQLRDESSRYQFFLQLRNEIIEGALLCSPEQAVLLAAYSLQAAYGDFDPHHHSPQQLKEFFLLPKRMCIQEEILKDLLLQVAEAHRSLQGMAPGMAETYYIIEAQNLEGYGEEYYAAKDASGNDLLLGTSHTGLAIKHPTGRPLLSMSWTELKSVTRAKRSSIRLECAGTGRAAQRVVQIFLENSDFATYVLTNILLQQRFHLQEAHCALNDLHGSHSLRVPLTAGFRGSSAELARWNGSKPDLVDVRPSLHTMPQNPMGTRYPNGNGLDHGVPSHEYPKTTHAASSTIEPHMRNGNSVDLRLQPPTRPVRSRYSWMGQEPSSEPPRGIVHHDQATFSAANSTPELRIPGLSIHAAVPLRNNGISVSSSTPDLLKLPRETINHRQLARSETSQFPITDNLSPLKGAVAQADLSTITVGSNELSESFPVLLEEDDYKSIDGQSSSSRERTPSRPLLQAAMNGLVLSDRITENPTATIPRRKISEHGGDAIRSDLESRLAGNLLIEFEQIPKRRRNNDICQIALMAENVPRNQQADVLPYDDTRVHLLEPSPDNSQGYINASEIVLKCEKLERRYIATQEPKENTLTDFLSMLWQLHTKILIVLSDNMRWMSECEVGKDLIIGSYQLRREAQQSPSSLPVGYSIQRFSFANKATRAHGKRKLYVFHLENWSEQGVPESLPAFCGMTQELETYRLELSSREPVVVLCRTGTGRSGMLILYDFMALCLSYSQPVDVPRVLAHMRLQRMYLCATLAQYRFVYAALIHHLSSSRLI